MAVVEEAGPDSALAAALRSMHQVAARIRSYDEVALETIAAGKASFIHYPVKGHELIPAALAQVLTADDYVLTTYRGSHDEVARGVPLEELWGEALGRRTGTSKGKGGPMHIAAPEVGLMLTTGIVGAGLPIANGLALAAQLRGEQRVAVCNFGDGATNIGAFHEALNLAAVWDLPVVFVCQNNGWAEHTLFADGQRNTQVVDRAAGYGMRGVRVDVHDARELYAAARDAVAHAREGRGPVLLECVTERLLGHVMGDDMAYADAAALEAARDRDPVRLLRHLLVAEGIATEAELDADEATARDAVRAALAAAEVSPLPDPSEIGDDVIAPPARPDEPGAQGDHPKRAFRTAINEALDAALAQDERVILFGEDVADSAGGGVFKVTQGLSTQHGEARVRNTPISEQAILGAAIGAAMVGLRPVAEIMFMDFVGVCFDQLANHAAKLRYMSGGRTPVPMTVRVGMAGGIPIGAQHAQSLEVLLMHTPGLKVVYPSTPYDAKGLLTSCIFDDDPCVFVESTQLMAKTGPVPQEPYAIPIGVADVKRAGSDVTIITWGRLVGIALEAAEQLAGEGASAEVLDLRSLAPLDTRAICESVARTKRAVVVHEAVRFCGPGAEIAALLHEEIGSELAAPVRRLAAQDTPVPASPALLGAMYPTASGIVDAVRGMG